MNERKKPKASMLCMKIYNIRIDIKTIVEEHIINFVVI